MNNYRRQYLFGSLFLAFGIFQGFKSDMLECSLYSLAGLSFIVNAMTFEPSLLQYKKMLVIITWLLLGTTGILFLYVLQFKYF